MSSDIASNHPKQKLLFFVAQDLDENIRSNVRSFVLRLASLKKWVNGPPRFVNSREELSDGSKGDMPVETVGGFLEIYSALPPRKLSRETDIQHLEEVTLLVNELSKFARENRLAIEFELDNTFVGAIEDGQIDKSLAEGLLGEWRRKLEV